ncbi:MAG: glycerol-3-phosphate acyltransferase [Clostridiales bacterium]|jgi:glycerol-3-phosphate acyltransferase PlsY|nr:glycerol-3-phosphate acyltransferase [Clostridiales bacterium]
MILTMFLSGIIGYFFGCFSTGLVLSRQKQVDIRSLGSKSTGATNMTRVLGIRYGLLTFVGDFLKAALAVLAGWLIAGRYGAMAAGLGAVIGHNWPAFEEFRGGKGIVCSIAVMLCLYPVESFFGIVTALLVIGITRYVSLGSLTFLTITSMLVLCRHPFWFGGAWALILLLLGVFRHLSNIDRLLKGTENKLDLSKSAAKKQNG